MSIIVSRKGEDAQSLEPIGIPEETFLQDYVSANIEALPMQEIDEDIRLLVVAKEFPTQSGAIDALALDQDGELYILETKLYRNPDKRKVLAQMLDYGAALWRGYGSTGAFLEDLRDASSAHLGASLAESLQGHFGVEEAELEELMQAVGESVENGAFRFVVLMDRMDDRLKDLISFVNENSRFTIYGVELEFYEFEELQIAIPKMYGAEVRKEVSSGSPRKSWDEASFFEDAEERLDEKTVQAIRDVYEYAKGAADRITWGTGYASGSFNPRFEHISPRSLITVYSDGRISVNFGGFTGSQIGDRLASQLSSRMNSELDIEFEEDYQRKYPQIKPEEWVDRWEDLIRILDDVVHSSGEAKPD